MFDLASPVRARGNEWLTRIGRVKEEIMNRIFVGAVALALAVSLSSVLVAQDSTGESAPPPAATDAAPAAPATDVTSAPASPETTPAHVDPSATPESAPASEAAPAAPAEPAASPAEGEGHK